MLLLFFASCLFALFQRSFKRVLFIAQFHSITVVCCCCWLLFSLYLLIIWNKCINYSICSFQFDCSAIARFFHMLIDYLPVACVMMILFVHYGHFIVSPQFLAFWCVFTSNCLLFSLFFVDRRPICVQHMWLMSFYIAIFSPYASIYWDHRHSHFLEFQSYHHTHSHLSIRIETKTTTTKKKTLHKLKIFMTFLFDSLP